MQVLIVKFALMAIMAMIVLWNVPAVLMKAVTPELDPVFMAARLDIMEAIAKPVPAVSMEINANLHVMDASTMHVI